MAEETNADARTAIIRVDFDLIRRNRALDSNKETEYLLFMKTVQGHAHEGHGAFYSAGYAFPDTTMDNICNGLKDNIIRYFNCSLDTNVCKLIKEKGQEKIDKIKKVTESIINGQKIKKICEEHGPLEGITFLEDLVIENPSDILKGLYLASLMDSYEWRKKVHDKYGLEIGGGKCLAVNVKKAEEVNLNLENLAKEEHNDGAMELLIKNKVIIPNSIVESTEEVVNAYVRRKRGQGISDDAAIIIGGKIWNKDVALGIFLGDAMDTWDKYTPEIYYGGQDEKIGDTLIENIPKIKKVYPDFELPSEEEILDFIFLAAMLPTVHLPDSSHRAFLERMQKTGQTLLEGHFNYLAGKKYYTMPMRLYESKISYHHHGKKIRLITSNNELYEHLEGKFAEYKSGNLIKNWRFVYN